MKDHGIAKTFWDEINRIRSIMRETGNYKDETNNQY